MKSASYRRRRASRRETFHHIPLASSRFPVTQFQLITAHQRLWQWVTSALHSARFIGEQGEMFCRRSERHSDSSDFGPWHPDRGDGGRKGRPVAMKTAAPEPRAALVWLYCHLMALSFFQTKRTSGLTDGARDSRFVRGNRINHFEMGNVRTRDRLGG